MNQMMRMTVLLFLVALIAAPAMGQEKQKKKKGNRDRQARGVLISLQEKLKKVELTAEQEQQIKKIMAKHEPPLKALAEKLQPAPGQRQAVMAARKKAAEEGKKGKELREATDKAMNLTDEQKELRKKQMELQQALQKEINAVLTPEQLKVIRAANQRDGAGKRSENQGGKKRGGGKKRQAAQQ